MEKILIIDDIDMSHQILQELLQPHFLVLCAKNGLEGYEVAIAESPDLIIMDIIMPVMDGFETTLKLKADSRTKHIPVIFITIVDKINEIVKAFEVGGIDYIIKPFNHLEVVSRINTHINLTKFQKQIIELTEKNSVLAMAVTVNHELRQPLTVLQGYFEKMTSELSANNIDFDKKSFDKITDSIDTIVKILNKYTFSQNFKLDDYLANSGLRMIKYDE
jgi:DNA-binding response OmpR family regulator